MENLVVVNARFLTQPITGTQRFAIELCRELKKLLPNLVLIAPNNIIHPDIAKELNVQVVGKIRKGIIWEQIELPIILRRYGNPLLINLCNLAPIFYSNNLVSILDLSFHLHPEWFSTKFSTLYNFFIPRAAIRAKRVITISNSSKNDIVKYFGVPQSEIDIVYPSVSNNFLNPPPLSSLNPYGKYVLAVSSIDPRKNFIGLIRAFKACNLMDTKLVIVGSEHKVFADSNIKEEVGGNKQIVFTGYIQDSELVELYQHALVFAYPSFFEGFGIPPLEAMACGCPTLVSNTTSLPEVCGEASVYVDPYDTISIRDGLLSILSNDQMRTELIRRGYEQISKFNWHQSAMKLADIIRRIDRTERPIEVPSVFKSSESKL
ncbi:glycosyltransferase family 4 protein [Spirosoma flavum]|uniref:Glycosyltransferase family 4 protein n=1 Tax=Spirosoma flavum TaxID=2048557 RepID=A0ABW6ADM5_9BACT